jgi:flagellar biosynthesis/type III secretory pathway protein FliH
MRSSLRVIKGGLVDEQDLFIIDTQNVLPNGNLLKEDASNRGEKPKGYEADCQKKEFLREAEEMRRKILADAQREKEEILQQAFQEGYNNGLAQGKQEGMNLVAEEGSRLREEAFSVLDEARKRVRQIVMDQEKEIISLAVSIAEKIINRLLEDESKDIAVAVAENALRSFNKKETVVIRVNEADYPALFERKELLQEAGKIADLIILKDPGVEKGGCVLQSNQKIVDAQLHSQIEEIKRILIGE